MSLGPVINSSINIGLPAEAPQGFKHPEVRAAVDLLIQTANNLIRQVEQYCGVTQKDPSLWSSLIPQETLLRQNLGRLYCIAGVNIAFGEFVNLYDDAGVLKARLAEATSGNVRKAHGYCSTSGGIAIGTSGEIILSQGLLAIAGIAPGQNIFLSTTPGIPSVVAATAAGQLEQFLGFGVATNLAYIDIATGPYVQH